MTDLTIPSEATEVEYVVGASASTGPFTIPFRFFQDADVKVSIDDGTSVVVKTITTDYTVAGVAVDGGFNGGTVTLVIAVSNVTVKIFRDIIIDRLTNFPLTGPFNISELNTELNKMTAIMQNILSQTGKFVTLLASSVDSDPWDMDGRPVVNVGQSDLPAGAVVNQQLDAAGPNWLAEDDDETAVGANDVWNTIMSAPAVVIAGDEDDPTNKKFDLLTQFYTLLQNRGTSEATFRLRYRYTVDCYVEVSKESNVSYPAKLGPNQMLLLPFTDIAEDLDYTNGNGTVFVSIDLYPVGIASATLFMQWRNLAVNTSEPR